jgi:RNA polymerase sigma factor (sigma-70 family)
MEASALSHPSRITGLRGPSALLRLQSDERLIALTRRGQHAAFEVLCARYQSRLLSFCRHMLASREDAEDVLQEVFAAAFNAVLADEREINVRPWLYRIARNRSLNHLRRASAIGVDSMDVHYAEQGISTGDKVMRRESFRELIDDVHHLPETQRTALLLREIDALSYEQVAHAMETTIPSVKSLLVRARISLAEAAEARNLSCDDVRLELGTVAEGLGKLSTPARRHVRSCQQCASFKKHLKDNNHALALILPVAPLLIAKKLLFAKLGSTASAGGAHVAGGAGATVAAGAAATGGGGMAGGLVTAGAGALATKAVAGLAAAAIVTAGAVAADNAVAVHHHRHTHAALTASVPVTPHVSQAPVVVRQSVQPSTPGPSGAHTATHTRSTAKPAKTPTAPTTEGPATTTPATKPTDPQATTQVTEVTTATTALPTAATTTPTTTPPPTAAPAPTPTPVSTTTTTIETGSVTVPTETTTTTPPPTQPPSEDPNNGAGHSDTPPPPPSNGGGANGGAETPATGEVSVGVEVGSE